MLTKSPRAGLIHYSKLCKCHWVLCVTILPLVPAASPSLTYQAQLVPSLLPHAWVLSFTLPDALAHIPISHSVSRVIKIFYLLSSRKSSRSLWGGPGLQTSLHRPT